MWRYITWCDVGPKPIHTLAPLLATGREGNPRQTISHDALIQVVAVYLYTDIFSLPDRL